MKSFLIFMSGAAIGSTITYFSLKKHFEDISNNEIESVKEAFKENTKITPSSPYGTMSISPEESTTNTVVNDILKQYSSEEANNDKENELEDSIALIDSDEFGGNPYYECKCLTLYSDGVLATDDDEIIEDPTELVGPSALYSFGKCGEDDVVYVKNDFCETYYEIYKDERSWSEVTGE